MTSYHYVAASERFLTVEEPLDEVLRERRRHYDETGRAIDFWLLRQPRFMDSAELAEELAEVPRPAAAVISTDPGFIDFMKLRLEFVKRGSFEAPTASIPDPLAEGPAADPPAP